MMARFCQMALQLFTPLELAGWKWTAEAQVQTVADNSTSVSQRTWNSENVQ